MATSIHSGPKQLCELWNVTENGFSLAEPWARASASPAVSDSKIEQTLSAEAGLIHLLYQSLGVTHRRNKLSSLGNPQESLCLHYGFASFWSKCIISKWVLRTPTFQRDALDDEGKVKGRGTTAGIFVTRWKFCCYQKKKKKKIINQGSRPGEVWTAFNFWF